MTRKREEILEERGQLRAEYGSLFGSVAALLFRHDPARSNFEVNPDEYNPRLEQFCRGFTPANLHRMCRTLSMRNLFAGSTRAQPARWNVIVRRLPRFGSCGRIIQLTSRVESYKRQPPLETRNCPKVSSFSPAAPTHRTPPQSDIPASARQLAGWNDLRARYERSWLPCRIRSSGSRL